MKTEYELSKHRYYELKHFCMQYPEWKSLYSMMDGWSDEISKNKGDTTSHDGIRRGDLRTYVELIEECAGLVDSDILPYVIGQKKSLPTELRYSYKRFFWELSRRR